MTRRPTKLAALALTAAIPGPAMAAANQCTLPAVTPVPKPYGPSEHDPKRVLKSSVYMLAMSWAPQFCATGEGMGGTFDRTFECDTKANRFGFTLHGLWPDGDGLTWPQYCRPAKLLRPAVIRANLCVTPLADLLQHEWAKHGTCGSWRTPERYFADARAAYSKMRFPDMEPLIPRDDLTVGEFAAAFAAANPGLRRESIRVALNRDGWLQEVRVCFDPRRRYMTCPGRDDPADRAMRIRPIA
jgi:ribonuclease T2